MIKQYKNMKLSLKERLALYMGNDIVYAHPKTKKKHRDPKDGPAVIYKNGTIFYMWEGNLHRDEEDGPASLLLDGTEAYYKHGLLHRTSTIGPAIQYSDGRKVYMENDKFHRIGGPAVIDYSMKDYYVNNKNVTVNVETWLHERNLCYETLSDEDYIAFCFFMETLN